MNKPPISSTQGPPLTAGELWRFLQQHTANNLRLEGQGKPVTPLCIWGEHGIGKTRLVEQFAREQGMKFSYLAPAQFEEMGDLAGLPELEGGKMVFKPAAWVPREEGPGILLIDDFNRADERILRGLMQLLQGYGLAGWQLPPRWQIVLTANPDRGDYSVTPLDEAMLTRMLHVELRFCMEDWLSWAEREGLDARALRFMRLYAFYLPDGGQEERGGQPAGTTAHQSHSNLPKGAALSLPKGAALSLPGAGKQTGLPKGRTTARSLTQFFRAIEALEDWQAELDQIAIYAQAALEAETADAFLAFVRQRAWEWPSPEDWLSGACLSWKWAEEDSETWVWGYHRMLLRYLQEREEPLAKTEKENLKTYLLSEMLNREQRLLFIRGLQRLGRRDLRDLLNLPEILEAML